jgi:hypothetical protein
MIVFFTQTQIQNKEGICKNLLTLKEKPPDTATKISCSEFWMCTEGQMKVHTSSDLKLIHYILTFQKRRFIFKVRWRASISKLWLTTWRCRWCEYVTMVSRRSAWRVQIWISTIHWTSCIGRLSWLAGIKRLEIPRIKKMLHLLRICNAIVGYSRTTECGLQHIHANRNILWCYHIHISLFWIWGNITQYSLQQMKNEKQIINAPLHNAKF